MKKRFLSILLCLALVFGVLPLGLLTLSAAATEPPELTNLVGRWDGELYKISFDQVEGAEKYNFNWSMTMSTTRYASSYVDTVTESITKPYFYIGNNTDPPFWVTIIAYNKYGEQIAKSTHYIKAPFEAELDTPNNVYLSPTGVLVFDPVEHAGAYEVDLIYKGTHLKTYQYSKIPSAAPCVDMSDWVCEKDGENFTVVITSYAEGFPDTRYGKYKESTYTNSVKYSSETALSGSVTINSDRTVTYRHYLKYLNERTSTPLHLQWQHYDSDAEDIENAWVNITESQKTSYPVQELRVIVTADGHNGSVTSKDNNYTDKYHPYVATSFKDLVRVFNRDHDNDKTIYIKLGCDISVTDSSSYLEATGGDVDLDLNGYTLYYRGTTRALIRAGYIYAEEPAEVIIRDSRRYDSSKGEWVDGKVIFDHNQYHYHYGGSTPYQSGDYLEYCGLTTAVLTGDITVYGGVFINESHKSYNAAPKRESGTLREYVYGEYTSFNYEGLKMYGGTFESSRPVCLESNPDGDEYGFYGGTIKSSGEWAVEVVIMNKENYSLPSLRNIKVINESDNEQIVFLNMRYTNGAGDVDSTRAFADLNSCYLSAAASYTDGVKNSFATQNMLYSIDQVLGPLFSDTYEIKTEIALKSLEFDITEPVAGEAPDYTFEGPESDLYSTKLVWKYERTPNTFRELEDKNAPFRTGLYYRPEVILTPKDGVSITGITGTHIIGSHVADMYSNDGSYYFYSNYRLRDTYFDIYIGGTQVGRLNKGDVIGDGGSVQFFEKGEYLADPYFKNSKVLVFNNFNMIKDDYTVFDTGSTQYGLVKAQILINEDIAVIIKGENSLGSEYSTAHGICLGSRNYINFYGDGKFTVNEAYNDNDAMIGFGTSVSFNEDVEFVLKGRYGARMEFDSDNAGFDLWDNAKVTCNSYQTEDNKDYPALKVSGDMRIRNHAQLICIQQDNQDAMSTWGDNFPVEYYDIKILKKGEFANSQTNPVTPYEPPVGFNMTGGVGEGECRYVSIKGKTVYATGISISPSSFTLTPNNNSRRVTPTLLPSYAPAFYDDLTWESSDESVVTVTKDGNRTATISGLKNGTATVTATAPGGASGTCEVTVEGFSDVVAEIASVEVTVNEPVAGDVPSYVAAVPKGSAYKIDDFNNEYFKHGVSWNYGDEHSSDAIMNTSPPTFKAGETYSVIVTLVPTDPAATVFADQNHFTATVNGAQAMATPLASRVFVIYTFILPAAGDFLPGDVDGNGKVEAVDALEVLKSVVGKVTLTDEQLVKADTDGNGKINAVDALYILKKVVGKIEFFPVELKG